MSLFLFFPPFVLPGERVLGVRGGVLTVLGYRKRARLRLASIKLLDEGRTGFEISGGRIIGPV